MQETIVIITVSELLNMPTLPDNVRKAQIANERAKYRKMLRDLCPSKEMRNEAKRLSKRQDSCEMCVYGKGEVFNCHYPHSDWYMEDVNIDPCYEGVLRYLVIEAEKAATAEKEIAALVDAPASIRKQIYSDNRSLYIVLDYLLDWADNKQKPSKEILATFRKLHNSLTEILPFYESLSENQ